MQATAPAVPTPVPARHAPTFSCVYAGPVDDKSVGTFVGPDLDGREAYRPTHTEPTGDGRTRAHFEPMPIHRIRELAADELGTDEAFERIRARSFWRHG